MITRSSTLRYHRMDQEPDDYLSACCFFQSQEVEVQEVGEANVPVYSA